MADARIGFEHFVRFSRTDENDFRVGITALGRIEQHAGDGHVRAQRHARKHVNAIGRRAAPLTARSADRTCAAQAPGRDALDHLGEQARVDFAESRLEQIAQSLDHDRKQRAPVIFGDGAVEQIGRPLFAAQAADPSSSLQVLANQQLQLLARGFGNRLAIGDQRVRQRRSAFALARFGHRAHRRRDQFARRSRHFSSGSR